MKIKLKNTTLKLMMISPSKLKLFLHFFLKVEKFLAIYNEPRKIAKILGSVKCSISSEILQFSKKQNLYSLNVPSISVYDRRNWNQ